MKNFAAIAAFALSIPASAMAPSGSHSGIQVVTPGSLTIVVAASSESNTGCPYLQSLGQCSYLRGQEESESIAGAEQCPYLQSLSRCPYLMSQTGSASIADAQQCPYLQSFSRCPYFNSQEGPVSIADAQQCPYLRGLAECPYLNGQEGSVSIGDGEQCPYLQNPGQCPYMSGAGLCPYLIEYGIRSISSTGCPYLDSHAAPFRQLPAFPEKDV